MFSDADDCLSYFSSHIDLWLLGLDPCSSYQCVFPFATRMGYVCVSQFIRHFSSAPNGLPVWLPQKCSILENPGKEKNVHTWFWLNLLLHLICKLPHTCTVVSLCWLVWRQCTPVLPKYSLLNLEPFRNGTFMDLDYFWSPKQGCLHLAL